MYFVVTTDTILSSHFQQTEANRDSSVKTMVSADADILLSRQLQPLEQKHFVDRGAHYIKVQIKEKQCQVIDNR